MVEKIKNLFWLLFSSGLEKDHDLEILRKVFLSNLIIFLGVIFLAILGTIAYVQNHLVLAISDFLVIVFLVWLFFYLRKKKNYNMAAFLGTSVIGLFFLFLVANGGVNNSAHVWAFTYPLISLFLLGSVRGSLLSLTLLFIISLIFIFGPFGPVLSDYPVDLIIRFIPAYIVVYSFALVMEKLREIVQQRLENSNRALNRTISDLQSANSEKETLISELQTSLHEIEVLQGILPICANCKKIRNDSGYWEQVEQYVESRSRAQFSHGICPECERKLYGKLDADD